jgi:ribonuclease HI
MTVTINTDASHDHQKHIGTYAYWIVSKNGRMKFSAILKGRIDCSNEAEIKAIGNALMAVKLSGWLPISGLYINTDSRNAIQAIKNPSLSKERIGKPAQLCANLILEFRQLYNKAKASTDPPFKLEYRKIKAHTHTATKRNWVNDWLDKEAKNQLRKARQIQ